MAHNDIFDASEKTAESGAGHYAPVNGLQLYYELHGTGEPLVLLHGGLGTIGMFAPLLPSLAASRQVIAVELQACGHTADIDRPMAFEAMADDIAALIEHLGLEKADILGYSMGGGVALQTAIRHPQRVRRLVVVSFPSASHGWYPEIHQAMGTITAQVAATWVGSPMHDAYAAVAPRPEDWATMAAKTGRMVSQVYDWSEEVAALPTPTMLVVGDADSIPPGYAAEMFGLLGGGKQDGGWDGEGMSSARLAILPGTTHHNILASPALLPALLPFLNAPMAAVG